MIQYFYIANLKIAMESYGRTIIQAKSYLCDSQHHVDFSINRDDVHYFKGILLEKMHSLCDDDLEYLATGKAFYRKLLDFNGMMLHSSCVVVDGKAYLFTANSGTGKSTHTALWLKLFGDCAYILNDDKPAVRFEDGTWYAYGTPWSGKNDISVNCRIPIAGVAILERSECNSISRMSAEEAVSGIIMQVNRSRDITHMEKIFTLCDQFVSEVPIWKLQCNMDPEAAIVSYEAMSGEKFVPNK